MSTLDDLLSQCEQLQGRLIAAVAQVRDFCSSITFRGDRAACAASADEVERFLGGAGQRLLERAAGGEEHAARNYLEAGSRMLATLTSTPVDFADNTLSNFNPLAPPAPPAGIPWKVIGAALIGVFIAAKVS